MFHLYTVVWKMNKRLLVAFNFSTSPKTFCQNDLSLFVGSQPPSIPRWTQPRHWNFWATSGQKDPPWVQCQSCRAGEQDPQQVAWLGNGFSVQPQGMKDQTYSKEPAVYHEEVTNTVNVYSKNIQNYIIHQVSTQKYCNSWYSGTGLRHVLACGSFKLVYDLDQEILWVAAAEGKKKESFEVKGPCELFGFGSGDYLEGPAARDVQSDLTGRWISFKLTSGEEWCILEADRRLPDHIKKMDIFGKALWQFMVCFAGSTMKPLNFCHQFFCHLYLFGINTNQNQVTTYSAALNDLEDAGEVGIKMSMHWSDRKEGAQTWTFKSGKDVCFVLDPPKEKKRKAGIQPKFTIKTQSKILKFKLFKVTNRQKNGSATRIQLDLVSVWFYLQANPSAVTFGSKISMAKLRTAENVKLCWRLRRLFQNFIILFWCFGFF